MSDPLDTDDFDPTTPQEMPQDAPLSARAAAAGGGHAPWLEGLNPEQCAAVLHGEGPLLVLAGAGTGKTRALTTRLAHLLASGRAWPGQILAVTFTNKAAREMKERIRALIGDMVDGMTWLGTFHSIGVKFLQRHGRAAGLNSGFTILDTDDQVRLLKQVMAGMNIDEKRFPARQMAAMIDGWKNRGIFPDAVPEAEAAASAAGRAAEVYAAYQARLRQLDAADFGDLIIEPMRILRADAALLAEYRKRFRYMLVDEYQDTNVAQYLLLRLLAGETGNICCVGDDDQSIYGWRGARVENILRFEKDFPSARVIRLERNYRSTAHILAAANGIIARNRSRLGKELRSELGEGEKVLLRAHRDDMEEAAAICADIEAARAGGRSPASMAVLVRASFQMRAIEERLLDVGIPYRVIGGPRFYERLEVRDTLAYLRVIRSPAHDLAFERIVNTPKRGIGEAALRRIRDLARTRGISLHDAAVLMAASDTLPARARNSLRKLMESFTRWREMAARVPPAQLAETVIAESGYADMWKADKTPKAQGRLENLAELARSMEDFESLGDFLDHVALVMEADAEAGGDKVSLMTMHAAKGLEFDTVFLPGWEEGLFPHQRALDESGEAALEEERRLAYVAITRARRRAVISFAANRRVHNMWQSALPSRFVDELPAAHVQVQAPGAVPHVAFATALSAQHPGAPATRRPEAPRFDAGQRIFHQKFGYGIITEADGEKLTIAFDKAGTKRIMAAFVEAA